MAEQDSRITVCTQDNRGQGHARNNGLKLAEGEFVYFVMQMIILLKQHCMSYIKKR